MTCSQCYWSSNYTTHLSQATVGSSVTTKIITGEWVVPSAIVCIQSRGGGEPTVKTWNKCAVVKEQTKTVVTTDDSNKSCKEKIRVGNSDDCSSRKDSHRASNIIIGHYTTSSHSHSDYCNIKLAVGCREEKTRTAKKEGVVWRREVVNYDIDRCSIANTSYRG